MATLCPSRRSKSREHFLIGDQFLDDQDLQRRARSASGARSRARRGRRLARGPPPRGGSGPASALRRSGPLGFVELRPPSAEDEDRLGRRADAGGVVSAVRRKSALRAPAPQDLEPALGQHVLSAAAPRSGPHSERGDAADVPGPFRRWPRRRSPIGVSNQNVLPRLRGSRSRSPAHRLDRCAC